MSNIRINNIKKWFIYDLIKESSYKFSVIDQHKNVLFTAENEIEAEIEQERLEDIQIEEIKFILEILKYHHDIKDNDLVNSYYDYIDSVSNREVCFNELMFAWRAFAELKQERVKKLEEILKSFNSRIEELLRI